MGLDIFFTRRKSNTVGYFRKVNFLIRYFEGLGFDFDHQDSFEISKEDAEVLLSRCNMVLKNKGLAEELLPTCEGFFFGSTEYGETYFKDVKAVRNFVKDTLLPQFEGLEEDEQIVFEICY